MSSVSLVDYLAAQIHCDYTSDLRFLNPLDRIRVAYILKNLSPTDWPVREWNDALEYIVQKQAVDTAEEAYHALLFSL